MSGWNPEIEELVQLTRSFVRIPSVLGAEEGLAARVAGEMERLRFDSVERDPAGNVVGILEGSRSGPTLLLDAHLDTVDVRPREAWSHDPFSGHVEEGRIYGRGSSDMKGALAAMLIAVASLRGGLPSGRLVVSASVEEERIEGAALRLVIERVRPDFVVVGEASDLNLVRAGRGRAEFTIEARGRPAHASTPALGKNAVLEMLRWVREIEELPPRRHPVVGESIWCLTDLVSVPYPAHSVVPSACRATYETRLVPGDTPDDVRGQLEKAARRAGVEEFGLELARARIETYTGLAIDQAKWLEPWETPEESPLVERAAEAVRRIHPESRLSSYQFCTNAAYSAGEAGIPTIGFGPSRESLAHMVDEYVEIQQLRKACQGYRAICEALCVISA